MRITPLATGTLVVAIGTIACSSVGTTPSPGPTAMPAGRSISGQVTYDGKLLDGHKIVVVAARAGEQGPPAYSVVLSGPGAYRLTDVSDGTYTLLAFIDLGDDMGSPQTGEPVGSYDLAADRTADPVVMAGGGATRGVDILISDP
jgi:hypothetical protein